MKISKKLKINYKFILIFLIVIFKYLKMQKIISNANINIILGGIVFIATVVLIKKRKIKNFNQTWLVVTVGFALVQLAILQDVDLLLLLLVALIFSEDKDAINKIIKYFFISMLIVFLTTIIMNKMGILKYKTISRLINGNLRIQRNSLGFSHPNEAYVYFFFIMLAVYYFIKSKVKYSIIMIGLSYLMYKETLSRTGLICSIVFVILIWVYGKKSKINKFAFFMGTITTFILAIKFSNSYDVVNELLSHRPYLYHYYISNSKNMLNIIGNVLEKGVTLDNAYLNIIFGSGWFFYIFYFIFYYISGEIIEKDRKLTKIFIIMAIYGCIETHAMNIGVNFLMFIQMYIVITKNNILKECKNNEKN